MRLGLGNSLIIGRYGNLGVPFKSDLNTWHKGVDSITFAESINNLPAKILPRVGSSNGTTQKVVWSTPLSNNLLIWTVAFTFNDYNGVGAGFVIGGIGNRTFALGVNSKFSYRGEVGIYHEWNGSGNTVNISTSDYTNILSDIIIFSDGTNIHTILNGIYKGYITPINTKLYFNRFILGYLDDTLGANGNYWDLRFWDSNLGQTEALKYHLNAMTVTPTNWFPDVYSGYDVVGSNHGTSNLGYDFDINGSTYPNDNGYSLWQKSGSDDIQVPFDVNGLPLSLVAGTNIPAGYTKTRDIQAGGNKHNIYESLVDMEYGSILNNTTLGVAYTPQTDAYGEWEWIVKLTNIGLYSFSFDFITTDTTSFSNGYILQIQFTGAIRLFYGLTLIFATSAGYVLDNKEYSFKVKRNSFTDEFVTGAVGTFAVYIKGDLFGENYVLIDVSGGFGSNPITHNTITVSSYFLVNSYPGDQVSKIHVNDRYISPYEFTVLTGAYSIIDNPKNAIFNRTNATRQTATSRASLFYDANYPFKYHIKEISDPRVYDTFFNTDYQDTVLSKVVLDGTDIIRLDEIVNYITKKITTGLAKVLSYCRITNIYP